METEYRTVSGECKVCGKKNMGNFPIKSAEQCECYVQYADRYMKYHRYQLSIGNTPQDYVKWARHEEKITWGDTLLNRNRKKIEHWIIKMEESK